MVAVRHLWQIDAALGEVERAIDDESLSEEERGDAITAWLEACDDLPARLDSYAALIADRRAKYEARNAEAERLQGIAAYDKQVADKLQDRLHGFLKAHEIDSIETSRYKLSIQKVGGVLPVLYSCSPEELPERYRETVIKEEIRPLTKVIRDALELGDMVPGATLGERKTKLTIK